MEIKAPSEFDAPVEFLREMAHGKPRNALQENSQKAMRELEVEFSMSDGGVGDSWHPQDAGVSAPIHVDSSLFGQNLYAGEDVRMIADSAAAATDPNESRSLMSQLSVKKRFNRETGRYDFLWGRAKDAHGTVGDAAPDLIGAQLASPGSIGYFTDIFLKPLIWSNAMKHVEVYTGTNPWAEMMTLVTGDFSGFAALLAAGAVSNNMSNDVEFQAGMQTQAVINASATYRISVEELERTRNPNSSFPFNGQPITYKQQYANFVLDLMRDYVIYYGIPQANINGLFQVNGTSVWAGNSLTTIANGGGGTEGHDMYIALAKQVATFLTNSFNMLSRVRIGMSPLALNLFTTYNYSSTYNPDTALVIMVKNFLAGMGKSGITPDIEIFSDPLLANNTLFNSSSSDYLVISAPEIVGGPDMQNQSLIRFGMPLPKFMYPVIPGMQGTPYKTLSRFGGVFAPYTPAVQVSTGFGIKNGS